MATYRAGSGESRQKISKISNGGKNMGEQKGMQRAEAFLLLQKWVTGETLLRHSITVEAVMRHFAVFFGGDVDEWGIIGLLHDIDFEKYPEEHCRKTRSILEPEGISALWIRAIESHGFGLVSDVQPETECEKVLFTIDELTGLVSATALMRPGKSLSDLEVRSVKKKWKSAGFAVGVNREVIQSGADMLGKELDWIIGETIAGMRTVAGRIGLDGTGA
jgi:predicted hydrolase (HD superfamily)